MTEDVEPMMKMRIARTMRRNTHRLGRLLPPAAKKSVCEVWSSREPVTACSIDTLSRGACGAIAVIVVIVDENNSGEERA
jgi:hypothetical protein